MNKIALLLVSLLFLNFSAFANTEDCEVFLEKLKKAEHGARVAQESYKGKGVAINVLGALENYPGTSAETNTFLEKTLATNSDKPGKFFPMCALDEFHAASIKVLSSASILLFNKEEKVRVKNAILKTLNAELAHTVSQMKRVKHFAHIIDHAADMRVLSLEKTSKESLKKIRESADAFQKGSVFLVELKESNKLNIELQKIVAKIQ